jgi:hypothetical protein
MPRLFTFLLLLCSVTGFAQLAVSTSANFHQTRWDINDESVENFLDWKVGNEVAVGYWFRLPEKRVEFLPTVYFASSSTDDNVVDRTQIQLREYGFEFKVNVYPFDFGGDCDCPTFGKQGPQLEKGFYIQLSPGYAVYDLNGEGFEFGSGNGITYGGGIGLDIGLSNLLTITPYANARVGTGLLLNDLVVTDVNGQALGVRQPKLTTFQVGIRALFRFDHRRY